MKIPALLVLLLLLIIATVVVLADDPPQEAAQPVPPEQVPFTGTFYSMTLFQPPLPMNPFAGLEVPVYAQADGSFVYDDRSIDYVAGSPFIAQSFGAGGGQMMSLSEPPPSPCPECPPCTNCPPDITNSPPYSVAGLKVTIPVITNDVVYLSIFEHDPALPYDIYFKSALNQTPWAVAATGAVAETNYFLASFFTSFTNQAFFAAGSGADVDADGIKDGAEALIWGTNPLLADSDGDGLSDGYELFSSFTDPFAAGPVPTLANRSLSRCPLP